MQLLPGEIQILRNDDPALFMVATQATAIILSPGPGRPAEAGFMELLVKKFYRKKPILGICLGHQAIGEVFGGRIISAPSIMHGKQSLLAGEEGRIVMRYHSLIVDAQTLPEDLQVTARVNEEIMAFRHKRYPIFGLQFHPESIGTENGKQYIQNFLQEAGI
ncbi:hypothetical protein RV04_GL001315 [Enterococcus hermanniensis]|uniref:Glutamine amidotransferase domain-containing protein n=1 Tax=Enterococcus hermanniensis TaxID=249189 RepID=A0A1L8TP95_9ENTE|nr:hypothetical protein RV04_GL001315 [Enterococcus hermanniensis]